MSDRNRARRSEIIVKFNGKDITTELGESFISLDYTDESEAADDLKITVNDRNGTWVTKWLVKENQSAEETPAPKKTGNWAIGDEVTVTGTPQYSSYGIGTPGAPVTNYTGHISFLNLDDGIPYPIAVDWVGWFAEADIAGAQTEEVSGNDKNNAKYTKITAKIKALNVDGNGKDLTLDCGDFELDNVDVSGPPSVVEMSASSVSFESGIHKTVKSRTWESVKLSQIAADIAGDGGLGIQYLSSFDPTFKKLVQDEKKDLEFLWEHCKKYALKLKVTAGNLVIYDSKDQDGEAAIRTFEYGDGTYSKYKLNSALQDGYASCHVSYEDDQGVTYEATFTPSTGYSGGEVLEVTEQVDDNIMALDLAKRRLRMENKKEMTGSFTVPGDPNLVAGVNVTLKGWGDFDGKYSVEKSSHKVSSGGYTTSIEIARCIEGY